MTVLLFSIVVTCIFCRLVCIASARTIISADGICKPVSFLDKKLSEDGLSEMDGQTLLGILDVDGDAKTMDLCNTVFGTSFTDNEIGKALTHHLQHSLLVRFQLSVYKGFTCTMISASSKYSFI